VDIFPAPSCFDQENGAIVEFLHGDAEGEFRADGVLASSEAGGEFAFLDGVLAAFVLREVADPYALTNGVLALFVAHFCE
jgi:hypothetical protein